MRDPDQAEPHQTQTERSSERSETRSEAGVRSWRLHILQTISDTALAHLELDELLNARLECIREAFSADNAAILLLTQDRCSLQVRAARGLQAEVMAGVNIPYEPALMECLAVDSAPLIIDDRSSTQVSTPFLHQAFASLVAVPLLVNGKLLGLLHVDSLQPWRFTQEDGQLLRLIGERIALAIDHARLYQETQAAQAQLQARAGLLEATLATMTDGVAMRSKEGNITLANQAYWRLLGFAPHIEYTDKPLSWQLDRIQMRDERGQPLSVEQLPLMRVLAGEVFTGSNPLIIRFHPPTGEERYVSVTGAPVLNEAGEISAALGVFRDVTEQQGMQHELREQAERLRAIFEQAAIGITQVALDGRFLTVNQRLCEILGYPREELMARSFQELTYPPDLDTNLALHQPLLAGEIPSFSLEKRYIRKDGDLVWVKLTVSLVRNAAGEPQYFISIVEDINARKQAEEEVRRLNATLERRVSERTGQLAEMNQEMEAFAYSVSHDLRAPLRAMQGFAQALQEDFPDELDPLARQYCRRIVAAAARMDTLILDLLAYSRISRAHLQSQPLSLAAALQEALNILEVEIHESQAQVVIKTPLPWVRAHPATLEQVVSNLLSNAIKFIEPGVRPQVEVWAEPREEGAKKRRWVRLWVADNGIGIDPAHQERIFRVFERLHGIETYPGTGIGLAIVKKGIERMGGRVGVESRPEAGSRFWVELPYAEQLSEAADAERIQNSSPGGR